MENQFERTELLFGKEAVDKLKTKYVAIFGLGGVGGYVLEGLARIGIQKFDIIDNDTINYSNLNRQVIALHSNIGELKTKAWEKRLKDINPEIQVNCIEKFCTKDNIQEFDFSKYDYVIDAIDTIVAKLAIIENTKKAKKPIISAMGAGNKTNPFLFEINDISKTTVCPLARTIRCELKKRKISKVKVIYSKEPAFKTRLIDPKTKKAVTSSCSFIPSIVGLMIASEVVKDLIKE